MATAFQATSRLPGPGVSATPVTWAGTGSRVTVTGSVVRAAVWAVAALATSTESCRSELMLPVKARVSIARVLLCCCTDETDRPVVWKGCDWRLNWPGDKDEAYVVPARSTVSRAPSSVRSVRGDGSVAEMVAEGVVCACADGADWARAKVARRTIDRRSSGFLMEVPPPIFRERNGRNGRLLSRRAFAPTGFKSDALNILTMFPFAGCIAERELSFLCVSKNTFR